MNYKRYLDETSANQIKIYPTCDVANTTCSSADLQNVVMLCNGFRHSVLSGTCVYRPLTVKMIR